MWEFTYEIYHKFYGEGKQHREDFYDVIKRCEWSSQYRTVLITYFTQESMSYTDITYKTQRKRSQKHHKTSSTYTDKKLTCVIFYYCSVTSTGIIPPGTLGLNTQNYQLIFCRQTLVMQSGDTLCRLRNTWEMVSFRSFTVKLRRLYTAKVVLTINSFFYWLC